MSSSPGTAGRAVDEERCFYQVVNGLLASRKSHEKIRTTALLLCAASKGSNNAVDEIPNESTSDLLRLILLTGSSLVSTRSLTFIFTP